jgi:hypothetical protein
MAFNIPQVSDLQAAHLARLQATLGQNAPQNDKAFLKVLSVDEAALDIGLYKFAADRAKANLALTAVGSDLDILGNNENTPRKNAQVAILTATLPATTGTIIQSVTNFISDANGLTYNPQANVTSAGGVATLVLQCAQSGSIGTLGVGDTFQIGSPVSGARSTATVTVVTQIGIDAESDTDYRPRVLFAQRAITGGANATDHKIWAEAVTGVKQAFCYSGRPIDAGSSYPGDRSVYVEATSDISSDGFAPTWLQANVRTAIDYDPVTGASRAPLGITDATLFIRSISRTTMFVTITGLICDADKLSQCQAAISQALTLYFVTIVPFVDGVDLPQTRSDKITSLSVGLVIQDVLNSFGALSTSVGFGLAVGSFLSTYTLGQGELTKMGTITYA